MVSADQFSNLKFFHVKKKIEIFRERIEQHKLWHEFKGLENWNLQCFCMHIAYAVMFVTTTYNILNVEMLEQSKMQIDSLQNDLGDPRFDRNALHWIFQAYLVHLENK